MSLIKTKPPRTQGSFAQMWAQMMSNLQDRSLRELSNSTHVYGAK